MVRRMFMDVGQSRCELRWTSQSSPKVYSYFSWIHILIFLRDHCPLPSQALRVGSWFRPVWPLHSLSHRGWFKDEHMTQPKLMRFADENILERDIISFLLILTQKNVEARVAAAILQPWGQSMSEKGPPVAMRGAYMDLWMCGCHLHSNLSCPKQSTLEFLVLWANEFLFFLQHIQPNKCLKCVH